jgi:hypothetical protein
VLSEVLGRGHTDIVMRIAFEIDGAPAVFSRNDWSGRAELKVGAVTFPLESPYKLSTHFGLKRQRRWQVASDRHEIEIVKNRPALLAGFRANSFTVAIDGRTIAAATGR